MTSPFVPEGVSPLPWVYWVNASHCENPGEASSLGYSEDGADFTIADFSEDDIEPEENTANARYIVTACNAYPKLLEALERLQWGGDAEWCAVCEGHQWNGHGPNCDVAALLSEARQAARGEQ